MNKTILIFVLILALIVSITIYGQAQTIYGLGAGISKITGDRSEYWNMGFNIGGELFRKVSKNIQAGGRIAYNRFGLNWNNAPYYFSSSITIFELLPSIRLVTSSNNGQKNQFFGQFGAGVYILEIEDQEDGWDQDIWEYVRYLKKLPGSTIGLNFGAGVIIGISQTIKFSISPMYNIVFTVGRLTKYFGINFSVLFSK